MKRICLIALLAVSVVACNKEQEETGRVRSAQRLSLSVSIDDAVKSAYTQDGDVLKYRWEVGDSISVVTLSGGNVATVDLFKAISGGSTAIFDGEFTGNSSNTILCVYPPLTEVSGSDYFTPPSGPGQVGYFNITSGKSTLTFAQKRLLNFVQSANADPSHIRKTDLMMGKVKFDGKAVSLNKRSSVIKIEATIPGLAASEKIRTLELTLSDGAPFTNYGASVTLGTDTSNWKTTYPVSSFTLGFGTAENGMFKGISISGNTLTAYVPVIPNTTTPTLQGSSPRTLELTVKTSANVYSAQHTIPASGGGDSYEMSGGHIYRINATLTQSVAAEPDPIEEVSVFQTQSASAMYLEGNLLYVGGGEIRIYDVSNPGKPTLLGTAPVQGGVRQLVAQNGYLYTSNRETGSYIYNVSDPSAPYRIGRYDCLELATGIDVAGNVLFISHRDNGVEFVDVSDPTHPRHITQLKTSESQSIFYKDGVLYSGEWGVGRVSVINASNMSNVSIVRTVNLQGFGDGVWAQGNRLYASTGHNHKNSAPNQYTGDGHGIEIYDITDPLNPQFISRVEFETYYKSAMDCWFARPNADGTMIYCTDVYNGFYVVDAHDEHNPKVVGRYNTGNDHAATSLAVGDGYVYLAYGSEGGILIKAPQASRIARAKGTLPTNASYRNPYTTPSDSKFYAWQPSERGQVHAAAVYDDALVVAAGEAGLYVVKQNTDGSLYQYQRVSSDFAGDVSIRGNNLYVARALDGVDIYSLSSGPTLTKKKTLKSELGDESLQFSVWVNTPNDKYLVNGSRSKGYSFIAIGGWMSWQTYTFKGQKSSSVNYNKFIADQVCGNDLLPYMSRTGLLWIDLSGSEISISSPTSIKGSSASGVTHFRDGTALYAVSDQIYTVTAGGTSGTARGSKNSVYSGVPRWDGANKVLFSTTNSKKIALVDVTNIDSPSVLFTETTVGRPEAGIFWNGKTVIPCGYQGLLVEK